MYALEKLLTVQIINKNMLTLKVPYINSKIMTEIDHK